LSPKSGRPTSWLRRTQPGRRYIAAKGQLARACRHGSAEKIAAAEERERHAYAEFARVSDVSIEEMVIINAAGLERIAELLSQMERAWHADP
jgi:hypothetical protein